MSKTPSRTQQLAHIASIAAKSKTEDSDVLFFKGGVYKGEWNPNATPNTFPNNTQAHDIFLVSHNGSYYGRVLAVGELVRFVSQHDPILVYSKYLPIPFFLSMLESEPPINSGGGFAYGGEWDATPQQVIQVAVFSDLSNCTVEEGVFTPTGVGVAMARNIAQADLTDANIRFTWPNTASGGMFLIGFGTPADATMQDLSNASLATSLVAIGSSDNVGMDVTKFGQSSQFVQENTGAAVGDIIILNFDYATNELRAYNETQEQALMSVDVSTQNFNTPLVLFIYGTVPIEFDIAGTSSPAKQVFNQVPIPENADGKTYLVTAATENSVVGGKLLKVDDFVTFFEDEGLKCVVNRLVSEADIQAIVSATLNEPNITPLELVNPIADGVTTVMLENANEINIVVNGEYDPAPQFNFNLDDTCFTQGRLVRIRLNAAIAIPTFNIAHYNSQGESVILENITAETAWVFVFEKRGAYAELIAKYQV